MTRFLLPCVWIAWGLSYPLMSWSLEAVDLFSGRLIIMPTSGLILLAFGTWNGARALPDRRLWGQLALTGLFGKLPGREGEGPLDQPMNCQRMRRGIDFRYAAVMTFEMKRRRRDDAVGVVERGPARRLLERHFRVLVEETRRFFKSYTPFSQSPPCRNWLRRRTQSDP